MSKKPEEFGHGSIAGVAGPESANNAASSSSFIPLLTLGIPCNASVAMIFAALMVQGITPGPFLITDHPELFWGVVASMYIGNVMLIILNLPMVGVWVQLLKVPFSILGPIIILFTVIGAYSINNEITTVLTMLAFGLIGYVLRKLKFETGPLLMAFILTPLIENAMRQSLLMSGGSFGIFVTRPISGTLFGLFALLLVYQVFASIRKKKKQTANKEF
jgi:putative tricarboxylic transport membrane protein